MIKLTINSIGRPDEPMYDLDWYYDQLRDYIESQGSVIPEHGFFLTLNELADLKREAIWFGRSAERGKTLGQLIEEFETYKPNQIVAKE